MSFKLRENSFLLLKITRSYTSQVFSYWVEKKRMNCLSYLLSTDYEIHKIVDKIALIRRKGVKIKSIIINLPAVRWFHLVLPLKYSDMKHTGVPNICACVQEKGIGQTNVEVSYEHYSIACASDVHCGSVCEQ